ncbi:transposon Tf2-8 polyprotein [Trichonephila clavipes]|nr:transposon Tf2-8 polyprotein [Trichonephila clavipes]
MNYYNANNEDINVKNNKGLDQIPDSPEADLKRLFNPAMVVEDTVPKQTSEPWEDLTQLLDKFQTIFSQNKYDVGCINLEPQRIHLISDLPISLRPYRNSQQESKEIQTQIEELLKAGYEITQGHYSPSNPNIETIRKLAPPKDVKELQRFLGSINVYQKFIKDYAKLRVPLNKLLKKDAIWNWSHECQEAYQKLKNCLISKPILKLYNSQYPCHVFCDASQESIGVVLKQQHPDGTLYPIAYHSRQLLKHEKNYTISEKECLAIIDALDKFHCYLHGSKFTIHTDHAALQWLKSVKHLTGRLFRWSLKLSQYEYSIVYIKANRPQCNEKNERVNQTLVAKLRCKVNSTTKTPWTKLLEQVTYEYNNSPHDVTGFPPAYLMFGTLPYDSPLPNQVKLNYPPIQQARQIAVNRTIKHHKINKQSDESQFCISGNQSSAYVRRCAHEEFSPQCLKPTVKYPTKGMVWSCMSSHGVGRLHIVSGTVKAMDFSGR